MASPTACSFWRTFRNVGMIAEDAGLNVAVESLHCVVGAWYRSSWVGYDRVGT